MYGLGRKWLTAAVDAASPPCSPLAATMRTSGRMPRNARIVAGPSMTGIIMSVMTAAISSFRAAYNATASAPSDASNTR